VGLGPLHPGQEWRGRERREGWDGRGGEGRGGEEEEIKRFKTCGAAHDSGSRLDRQWYSLRGCRPFTPPPLAVLNNLYL